MVMCDLKGTEKTLTAGFGDWERGGCTVGERMRFPVPFESLPCMRCHSKDIFEGKISYKLRHLVLQN